MSAVFTYIAWAGLELEFQADTKDSDFRKAGEFYAPRFQWLDLEHVEYAYKILKKLEPINPVVNNPKDQLEDFVNALRCAGAYEIAKVNGKYQIVAKGFQKIA